MPLCNLRKTTETTSLEQQEINFQSNILYIASEYHFAKKIFTTVCDSHFRSPAVFNILKEPLLVQKQTLHQQKALDLCYLEPEGQGRGSIMGVPHPFGAKSIFC